MSDDPGMKEMLAYLIARDTYTQNQFMAVIEELGGMSALPIPNNVPDAAELKEFSYLTLGFNRDGAPPPQGRWSSGPSVNGQGAYTSQPMEPRRVEPQLRPIRPDGGLRTEQMVGMPISEGEGFMSKVAHAVEDTLGVGGGSSSTR